MISARDRPPSAAKSPFGLLPINVAACSPISTPDAFSRRSERFIWIPRLHGGETTIFGDGLFQILGQLGRGIPPSAHRRARRPQRRRWAGLPAARRHGEPDGGDARLGRADGRPERQRRPAPQQLLVRQTGRRTASPVRPLAILGDHSQCPLSSEPLGPAPAWTRAPRPCADANAFFFHLLAGTCGPQRGRATPTRFMAWCAPPSQAQTLHTHSLAPMLPA